MRLCAHPGCENEIPSDARSDKLFCSHSCRRASGGTESAGLVREAQTFWRGFRVRHRTPRAFSWAISPRARTYLELHGPISLNSARTVAAAGRPTHRGVVDERNPA